MLRFGPNMPGIACYLVACTARYSLDRAEGCVGRDGGTKDQER